jgi:hypothetical protein
VADPPEPPTPDPLADLREHVRHAHAAAERLVFEAGGPEAGAGSPPPRTPPGGWASPQEPDAGLGRELRSLVELLESLDGLLPAELRDQLYEVVRQILLLIRAVVDWLVARLQREAPAAARAEVQDIPIH